MVDSSGNNVRSSHTSKLATAIPARAKAHARSAATSTAAAASEAAARTPAEDAGKTAALRFFIGTTGSELTRDRLFSEGSKTGMGLNAHPRLRG